MRTEITRPKYEREGQRYASDVTDAEWALIAPHMPAVKRLGRPRETELRAVLVLSRSVLEFDCAFLRLAEDIGSCNAVNRLVSGLVGEGLPSVDFAHRDLTGGEQRPEQHGCGLGRRQHRLGLDAALELLVEAFDCVGGTRTLPLADGQPGEGEQPVTGLLEAVGHRLAFEPPFADEGPPVRLDFRS